MAVVNDVPGAWEAIRAEGERLGRAVGIQPEVFWGFFNSYGRFPSDLRELVAWGNDPTNNQYNYRRRQENGVWTPLGPGDTPGTMGARDPGFPHAITNPVHAQTTPAPKTTKPETQASVRGPQLRDCANMRSAWSAAAMIKRSLAYR